MPVPLESNRPPSAGETAPQTLFDYHRTIIAYHGTDRKAAKSLVDGAPFTTSENEDDWLGHGIYFWEYAPQQAWWWAQRRYGQRQAAVVGSIIRLGRCLDLLDPANVTLLKEAYRGLASDLKEAGMKLPRNANTHKYLDCAVFRHLYHQLDELGYVFQSCRAVFVPMQQGKMPRLWDRSGVFAGGHIQVCVREAANILAVGQSERTVAMARIKEPRRVRLQPQSGSWTPASLVAALRSARKGDRVSALKRSGILTKEGKLARPFRSWGKRVSRTPDAKAMGIQA